MDMALLVITRTSKIEKKTVSLNYLYFTTGNSPDIKEYEMLLGKGSTEICFENVKKLSITSVWLCTVF